MLKLFAAKHTVSLASALILEELGTEYDLCLVDITARAQREKPYLDINPKGRVPTLVTPNGILTETGAILEYIAPNLMSESCAYVETLIMGPYIFGSEITIADAHLFTLSQWLEGDGVDINTYPKLAAFERAFAARPSVATVHAKGLL